MNHKWQTLLLLMTASLVVPLTTGFAGEEMTQNKNGQSASKLPHVRIDRKNRYVEVDAEVMRHRTVEGEWLELVACTRSGRDHETILVVDALPSHIHVALLTLDLQTGSPMRWTTGPNGVVIVTPTTGPRVAVTVVFQKGDDLIEMPVNRWVRDRRTGQLLADNIWLFTGSRFVVLQEKPMYIADLEGSVISLVNFGDELLARPTQMTRLSDEEIWMTADDIPAKGTKVKLRLRPLPKEEKDKNNHSKTAKDEKVS